MMYQNVITMNIVQNKIVISPSNKKAISFFEELNKKKAQIKKDIENSLFVSKIKETAKKSLGK